MRALGDWLAGLGVDLGRDVGEMVADEEGVEHAGAGAVDRALGHPREHTARSELDELVVGVTLEQLHRADRVLAVAGGPSKYPAIRAALLGGWVNTLVTDLATADHLVTC